LSKYVGYHHLMVVIVNTRSTNNCYQKQQQMNSSPSFPVLDSIGHTLQHVSAFPSVQVLLRIIFSLL